MIGVYKITNLKTGDFYIGKSKNTKKRMYNHRYPGIHSGKFETDIQTFGWDNFSFEVIEECTLDNLHEREAYYIELLKPPYNSIARRKPRSEATREKLRKAATGKKQSAETIEKRKATIRELRKTTPQTNAGHRKRVCVFLDYPLEFESVKSAAEFLKVDPSTITHAAKSEKRVKGAKVWYVV